MKLRDNCWLWGHPEGRYNHEYGNELESRMTPMEACQYLGIRNTFMIPVGWDVNRRQYNKSFTTLNGVAWECYNAGRDPSVVEPLIQEAADFPNIKAVVFDDFQRGGAKQYSQIPVENLRNVHERLHNNEVRPLDMWMVLYTHEFALDPNDPASAPYDEELFKDYVKPFDGIIMWTWAEKDVPLIPAKYEAFKELTKGQRRLFGCYLWNFGQKKQATPEAVKRQLDFYREKIMAGEAEGIVLHTNTMADLDYPAYDAAIEWMNEHGDEELPEPVVAIINSHKGA